jgi:hypothetical protein
VLKASLAALHDRALLFPGEHPEGAAAAAGMAPFVPALVLALGLVGVPGVVGKSIQILHRVAAVPQLGPVVATAGLVQALLSSLVRHTGIVHVVDSGAQLLALLASCPRNHGLVADALPALHAILQVHWENEGVATAVIGTLKVRIRERGR